MFQRVVSHKGFWKSVVVLGFIYMAILFIIQWAFTGFSEQFFTSNSLLTLISIFVIGSFICGFSVTYAKIWGKLKREDHKKR